MLQQEFTKLSLAKKGIRKAIQRKRTGLTLEERFETYPPYIASMHSETSTVNSDGLINYCEDTITDYTIPDGVTTIRDYAFYDYTNLQRINLTGTSVIELQGTHAFDRTSLKYIAVPSSLVSKYKAATNWSNFADLIVASGTGTVNDTTILVEHEDKVASRTVDWFNSLTIEDLTTDRRI